MRASIPKASCAPCRQRAIGRQARAGRIDHHPTGGEELPALQRADLSSARSGRLSCRYGSNHLLEGPHLELYLNEIYLGLGNYGVAAAALNYFGKSVHELTIAEVAYLAALPKAPNNYHPYRQKQAAIERRNWVVDRMADNGYIKREEADAAKKEPLTVSPRSISPNSIASGYFAEGVRRDIADRYGEETLYEGGLLIRSTLDPQMQAMARKALVDGLVRFDEARGWRGAHQKLELTGREWGLALAEVPVLGTSQPWRFAVVLEVAGGRARIGIQPKKGCVRTSGHGATERLCRRGWHQVDPADRRQGAERGRRDLRGADGRQAGPVPPAPDSGDFRRDRGDGSLYGPRPCDGRRVLVRPERVQSRQPGHAPARFLLQADVYATALDKGYTPSSQVLDAPFVLDMGPGQAAWAPSNYDGKSAGLRTLRYGVEHSKNLMTVRLANEIGMPAISEYARRFGVYDDLLPLLSMSLAPARRPSCA